MCVLESEMNVLSSLLFTTNAGRLGQQYRPKNKMIGDVYFVFVNSHGILKGVKMQGIF